MQVVLCVLETAGGPVPNSGVNLIYGQLLPLWYFSAVKIWREGRLDLSNKRYLVSVTMLLTIIFLAVFWCFFRYEIELWVPLSCPADAQAHALSEGRDFLLMSSDKLLVLFYGPAAWVWCYAMGEKKGMIFCAYWAFDGVRSGSSLLICYEVSVKSKWLESVQETVYRSDSCKHP